MTTPDMSELRAQLDQILKAMADVDPSRLTVEEWRDFKARVRDLEQDSPRWNQAPLRIPEAGFLDGPSPYLMS
jgi:hypothetical protein